MEKNLACDSPDSMHAPPSAVMPPPNRVIKIRTLDEKLTARTREREREIEEIVCAAEIDTAAERGTFDNAAIDSPTRFGNRT